MNAIELKSINFAYNKNNYVLNNLNLVIDDGKIHGLLGHNGAGKTTVIRIIVGLLEPINGTISLFKDSNNKFAKDFISYMPESIGIYEKLNSIQNLEFRGKAEGLTKKETEVRTRELLTRLGLERKKKELAGYLSHGLRKRLSLACALIKKPKLLLLDEPTNGIDPVSLKIIINLLKALNEEGTTILISSHDLATISKLCSSFTIIQEGKDVYNQISSEINLRFLESIYFEKTEENI